MMGFGWVSVWWELIPLRLVLGVFEAGFYPGWLVLSLIQTYHMAANPGE